MLCDPFVRVELAIVQLPPVATAVPISVAPSNSVTAVPASAVPVKVGVVTLVILSLPELPLSDAVARSGVEGAAGAAVSMVTASVPEAALVLPGASVGGAVMLCDPFVRVELAIVQLPPVATAGPISVVPSNSVTVVPASAVPVKVGVVTLVMLSVTEMPLSDAVARSGVDGAPGAVVSMVTL